MPIKVYLDTQDFSRFGDHLRGCSSCEVSEIYTELIHLKDDGRAEFYYSAPLVCELFQYDDCDHEITKAKAAAIEELCGGKALVLPNRLVAMESVEVGLRFGIISESRRIEKYTNDDFWYPDVSGIMKNMRALISTEIEKQFSEIGTTARWQRQVLKKTRKKITRKSLRAALMSSEISDSLGVPSDVIEKSFVNYLDGKVDEFEASRTLFAHMSKPNNFIDFYFGRTDGDRSLPRWLKQSGAQMYESIADVFTKHGDILDGAQGKSIARMALLDAEDRFSIAPMRLGEDEVAEFTDQWNLLRPVMLTPSFAREVPSAAVVSALFKRYLEQIMGLHGNAQKPDKSFAGDLLHALYVPSVDLWRGDKKIRQC